MGFWSSIWDGICKFAKASWNFMLSIIDATLEFIGETIECVMDLFSDMFTGIIDLLRQGLAKLYVICIPDEDDCVTDEQEAVRELVENAIKSKGQQIKKFRLTAKTDANGKVQDVGSFYNKNGSSMAGLDDEIRNEGIVEITL